MHTHTIRDLNVLESSATRLEVQHTAQKALQEDDLHAIATLDRLCCSVLQRVAACCSVLHHCVACCSVLQCAAVCCIVLHCVAMCCSVLHHCEVDADG